MILEVISDAECDIKGRMTSTCKIQKFVFAFFFFDDWRVHLFLLPVEPYVQKVWENIQTSYKHEGKFSY